MGWDADACRGLTSVLYGFLLLHFVQPSRALGGGARPRLVLSRSYLWSYAWIGSFSLSSAAFTVARRCQISADGVRWARAMAEPVIGRHGVAIRAGIHTIDKMLARQAMLEDISTHALRHCFAASIVEVATSPDQVAAQLGHESSDMTRICT